MRSKSFFGNGRNFSGSIFGGKEPVDFRLLEPLVACIIIANGIMIGFQTDPEYRDWDGCSEGTLLKGNRKVVDWNWKNFIGGMEAEVLQKKKVINSPLSQVGFGSRQPSPSS